MSKTLRLFLISFLALTISSLHAQWAKTNGLPGGDVGGFLLYGDTILANAGNDLYFSANHGQTWLPVSTTEDVTLYESDADNQNILVRHYDPNTGYRLIRSDDFGQNWHSIASPDTMLFYETFLAYGFIYGTDYHGLYRTNNDGATWEYTTTRQISNIQFDGQHMTGSSYPYLLQSSDGGFTWDTLLQVSGNVIDMLQHDNFIFAFMQSAQNGCYASSDYGQTWQHFTGVGFDQYSDFIWQNGSIYGVKGSKISRSPDLGQTWMDVTSPNAGTFYAFSIASTGNALLVGGLIYGESANLYRSTDNGDSWSPAEFGVLAASGKLRSIDNNLFAATVKGVYKLDADETNWTNLNLNILPSQNSYGGFTDFVQSGDNLITCKGGAPQVSLDGGVSWFESFLPSSPSVGVAYLEILGNKVLGKSDNIDFNTYFISDNNGLTFSTLQTLYDQYQVSIAAADVDQGKLYALGYDNQIYRSDDNAASWTPQGSIVPTDSLGQWAIVGPRLFVRGNVMYIFPDTYIKKMLYSKDGGQNWTYYNLQTAGFSFGDATFSDLIYVGNNLIAATTNGIFRSENDGLDWMDWSDGLTQRNIDNLEVHDNFLWAGTTGSGIWKRSLAELGMMSITGKVYFDENANAQQDPGEPNLGNVIVQSISTQAYTNTHTDGTYNLLSNLSQEQIKVNPPKIYWLANPATQSVSVPGSAVDFALTVNPDARDLSVELTNVSALRPGFKTNYLLSWRNAVPLVATNVSLTLNYPLDLLDLISVFPAPDIQSGGTLTWNLGDVPANANGNILLQFMVPVSDSIGTEVCANASIAPLAGDLAAFDNTRERCVKVVGSFDPNDKEAEPADLLTPDQLANNEPIVYTIRFQNTGNFPATIVRIADTLQQYFDPASFQFLSSSHPCQWSLRGQGEVEFLFNNIELPPVTIDEPGSHGFVKYSVRPRQNLPHGTPLRNTAHIFFDFNAPVTTNTTETLAGLVKTTEAASVKQGLQIAPNPAASVVRIKTDSQTGTLTLRDAAGRIVLQQSVETPEFEFSVDGLPQGHYQVVFTGEKSVQQGVLVVQR